MKNKLFGVVAIIVLVLAFAVVVSAAPSGVTITSNRTDTGATSFPANRSDPGGSITTLVLDAVQQDTQWKAYVGNITGSLRLTDSASNTIFDWSLSAASVTGEIYASRSSSVTWASIACSSLATIQNEHTALGINSSGVDSINSTFNYSIHPGLVVAGVNIGANSCSYATSTFVNNARQAQASADFPIILLHDTTNLIYTTIINQDNQGYIGANTYDFQLIVPDIPTVAATTYYFYAELGS
jgi:hypothetical protein